MRMYVKLGLLLAVVLALPVLLPSPEGASGTTRGYPDSMAALGDSITRAMDADPTFFGDQPWYSWSTGYSSIMPSQYYHIRLQNSLIRAYNDAVSGAIMADLNGQAVTAVSQGVEYVTILMGGNDVCTGSEETMTDPDLFSSEFDLAMDTLTTELPDARIFVASIPNVYRLWDILHTNETAVLTWQYKGICQSLLLNPTSEEQVDKDRRDAVRLRNIAFNTKLSEVCAKYPQCRFDNNAVFNSQFGVDEVSTLDYFHPSIIGQANTANLTWGATYEFLAPVGGVAELPDASDSSGHNYIALAGLAAAVLVALGAGAWYARRRWLL
ncbi:MAG: SGNH/GDSL hydrolase family protein [Dehalococcoidia bacterium]